MIPVVIASVVLLGSVVTSFFAFHNGFRRGIEFTIREIMNATEDPDTDQIHLN